jgi:hypothetical protein
MADLTTEKETKKIGKGKPGPGRPKNLPNKATTNAREAIAALVEGNVGRLNGWLSEIHTEQGAKAAWDCFMDVVEYHIPKLARTEHVGKDGGDLKVVHQIELVDLVGNGADSTATKA